MERDEALRQRYQEVLQGLATAPSWLERPTAEREYASNAQRSAKFHVGEASGLAFLGHLPGMKARTLDSLYGAAISAAWKEGVRRRGEPSPQVEGANGGNRESGRFRRIFAVQRRARFIFLPGFRARPEAFGS